MIELPENLPQEITPETLKELARKRDALRAEGFELECDQPNTAKGRAEIMAKETALKALGFRTLILKAIALTDLWKKPAGEK